MGVTSLTYEYTTPIPASKMFKAINIDARTLLPKILPHVKSIEIVEGDGGAGSVQITHFVEGSPYKFIKQKIDALDATNYTCKYSLIEGDVLGDKLKSVVYEAKYEPKGEGCVCKVTSHYHAKGGAAIKEEELKGNHEETMGLYKVVEDYLLANPHYA